MLEQPNRRRQGQRTLRFTSPSSDAEAPLVYGERVADALWDLNCHLKVDGVMKDLFTRADEAVADLLEEVWRRAPAEVRAQWDWGVDDPRARGQRAMPPHLLDKGAASGGDVDPRSAATRAAAARARRPPVGDADPDLTNPRAEG